MKRPELLAFLALAACATALPIHGQADAGIGEAARKFGEAVSIAAHSFGGLVDWLTVGGGAVLLLETLRRGRRWKLAAHHLAENNKARAKTAYRVARKIKP